MSDTDLQLLARYTRDRAEDAFAEVVRRHLDLVHSAALRQVRSPQLAEEVAQSVFTDLARNARRLAPDTILTAWLYQVTRRTAIDVVRREARRQLREQIATEMNAMNATTADWTHIEPLLDEAMHALDETDRAAVLLRYFENKSLREVGVALGTSDDAAQKRVSRAVERLREFFTKRGVTVGAGGLAVVISANAVHAAPAGLAVTISTAAGLAGTTITTATVTKAIAMTALQKTLIAVTLAASVAAPLVIQHQNQAGLREENAELRRQIDQQAQLRAENERLSNLVAQPNPSQSLPNDQFQELLKLRGEVGLLRQQTNVLEKSQEENRMLRSRLAAKPNAPGPKPPPDVAPQDIYPRESWTAAGYADPRSAFQSVVLATTRGDAQAYLAGLSPEMMQMRQKEIADASQLTGKSEADLAAETIQQYKAVTGYRILDQQTISDDQVLLHVYLDGVGVEKSVRMKKIGNEWKLDAAP